MTPKERQLAALARLQSITSNRLLAIAAMAHAVNRAYCQAIGDHSQPEWADAPDWQCESAMAGVRFHIANPEAGPDASHQSWYDAKLVDGWVYGPIKDPAAKTHPCMVPFEDLPQEQQAKDHLFRAVVHAYLEHAEGVQPGDMEA